jgi:hypothetical protein
MAGGAGFFGARPSDSLIAFTLEPIHIDLSEQRTASPRTSSAPAKLSAERAVGVQSGPVNLPEGKGMELVQGMCARCHPIDVVTSERHDRVGWSSVVQSMVARGATGTSQQVQQVIEYLTAHFGL